MGISLPPLPPSLWSLNGLVMRACTGELGVKWQPERSLRVSAKGFLADAFLGHCPPIPSSGHTLRQLIDKFASFPSKTSKAFHRKGYKFMAALLEGHMSDAAVVVALSRFRS